MQRTIYVAQCIPSGAARVIEIDEVTFNRLKDSGLVEATCFAYHDRELAYKKAIAHLDEQAKFLANSRSWLMFEKGTAT